MVNLFNPFQSLLSLIWLLLDRRRCGGRRFATLRLQFLSFFTWANSSSDPREIFLPQLCYSASHIYETRHAPLGVLTCRYAATGMALWLYANVEDFATISQNFCRLRFDSLFRFTFWTRCWFIVFFLWNSSWAYLELSRTSALLTKFDSLALALRISTLALRYYRNRATATLWWTTATGALRYHSVYCLLFIAHIFVKTEVPEIPLHIASTSTVVKNLTSIKEYICMLEKPIAIETK